MRKIQSALICAVTTLCAAGLFAATPLQAKTPGHRTSKVQADQGSSTTPYLQCVTFVRQFTGMQIFGDAWTWWEKATGKYDEGQAPKPGAVLVFRPQGKMKLGHVAVVSQIITDRYIQVTHANWSPVEGHRGRVEENVNVMDVSEKGDWSQVKVWYGPLNDLGTTIYPTYGFIYQQGQAALSKDGKAVSKAQAARPQRIQTAPARTMAPPVTQIAVTTADLPDDVRALMMAGNAAPAKPVVVSARATGPSAQALVAKLDANVDATRAAAREIDAHTAKPVARP